MYRAISLLNTDNTGVMIMFKISTLNSTSVGIALIAYFCQRNRVTIFSKIEKHAIFVNIFMFKYLSDHQLLSAFIVV